MKRKIVVIEPPKCFGQNGKDGCNCAKCYFLFDCVEEKGKRKEKAK